MKNFRGKLRARISANHRRRSLKKFENKLINRRQMLFLQTLAEETEAKALQAV